MPEYAKKDNYNEIIGVANGEIVVLEYTFVHDKSLKGAVGYTMTTLTQEAIDIMRDPENIAEYWQDCVANGQTTDSLKDWAEKANEDYNDRNGYSISDDPSFRYETDQAYDKLTDEQKEQLNKAIGEKGVDFVDWSVGGCGRCIPTDEKEYSLLLNPQLLEEAKKYEQKGN